MVLHPLNTIQNFTKKYPIALNQTYISSIVFGYNSNYGYHISQEEYNKILKDAKEYFTENDFDKKQMEKALKSTIDYHLTQDFRDNKANDFKSKEELDTIWCEWLPSQAPSDTASVEHMAYYGQYFKYEDGINGELPGERKNCQCGIRFLTTEEIEQSDLNK